MADQSNLTADERAYKKADEQRGCQQFAEVVPESKWHGLARWVAINCRILLISHEKTQRAQKDWREGRAPVLPFSFRVLCVFLLQFSLAARMRGPSSSADRASSIVLPAASRRCRLVPILEPLVDNRRIRRQGDAVQIDKNN